jgi:hypothetical protein
MTDSGRRPDSNGNFGTTRQPLPNPGIRPPVLPGSLVQIDNRQADTPGVVFVDQAALAALQTTPVTGMRNRHPR